MKKSKRRKKARHLHRIPGEAVYVGNKNLPLELQIVDYSPSSFTQKKSNNYKDAFPYRDTDTVTWITITGLNQVNEIQSLGAYFGLHPLLIEDIVNTEQRPKFEEFSTGLFLISKMLTYNADETLRREHVALVLGPNYVLAFQDGPDSNFENLKKRIETSAGQIRKNAADFLLYATLDIIVDDYFVVADQLAGKGEVLEEELFKKNPREGITEEIQLLKREIMRVRKAVQPLRESIKLLEKSEHPLIHPKTRNYLRDLSDHTVQVTESIEIYREVIWSLMEMYMATASNRMDEVMKVLTIMASLFIPLTFIAGVYGMNFQYMPELEFRYAYFVVLGVMVLIAIGMLWYFKRKKWL